MTDHIVYHNAKGWIGMDYKKQMMEFLAALAINYNESNLFREDLKGMLRSRDDQEWNNQVDVWLDILENHILYDDDGGFVGFID